MSCTESNPPPRPGNYPFGDPGRASVRLLFDFSTGIGCFPEQPANRRVLDFACGTGWTSEWLSRMGYEVHGFDCDAACIEAARARAGYDVAMGMYHDQALIPLKTLDMRRGVNITLGLPIIRTSPDHGTAFAIAGQGIADASSLIAAIDLASDLARRQETQ